MTTINDWSITMKKPNFNFDTTNLKRQIEEQPLIALGVASAALSGAAKLLNANTNRRNSKTWNREVKRREKSTSK